jgi:hypothetical protein
MKLHGRDHLGELFHIVRLYVYNICETEERETF